MEERKGEEDEKAAGGALCFAADYDDVVDDSGASAPSPILFYSYFSLSLSLSLSFFSVERNILFGRACLHRRRAQPGFGVFTTAQKLTSSSPSKKFLSLSLSAGVRPPHAPQARVLPPEARVRRHPARAPHLRLRHGLQPARSQPGVPVAAEDALLGDGRWGSG